MTRPGAALDDLRSLDTLASRGTALAQLDARGKIVVTLAYIVTVVSFDRYNVAAMLPLALFPTVLAAQGDVPARLVWRGLWLALPFAVMVGIFNPLLDRTPMLVVAGVDVSGGWVSFTSILLRCGLTVSATLLLVAGTGMVPLCAALGRLGISRVFTVQLLFLHRYLFVLAGEATRMATARRLRAGVQARMSMAVHASLLGHLLLRALDRAQRVHSAMLARGFDGELRLAEPQHWRRADTVFVGGWCAFFLAVRLIDVPHAIGALLAGSAA